MPKTRTEVDVLQDKIVQAEQAVANLKENDLLILADSSDAVEQLPVRMVLAWVGYEDLSWTSAQEALRTGKSLVKEVLSMEGDQFLTRRVIADIGSLGKVDPGSLENSNFAAHALAAYLEACLLSAGHKHGIRTPTASRGEKAKKVMPPAWPIKIEFKEIMKQVDEAARWGRTALLVCNGHAREADTFFSYRGFTSIDAKWMMLQVSSKQQTTEDMHKLLHRQLVDSMRCGLPLHIAMSSSAVDFQRTFCKDNMFPATIFNTGLFRKPLEYSKVLSDMDRKGWALNIVDRMKHEFYTFVTTDMDVKSAQSFLSDAVPHLDKMAIVEIDTASFEADQRAAEARKQDRLAAKYGQRASDNVG